MKKIQLLASTGILFFISCNKKIDNNSEKLHNIEQNQINPYTSKYDDEEYMKNLLDKAILHGDTTSYKEAYKNFVISNHHKEFLYYSMKMSEKYNFSNAYYNTYHLINLLDNINGYNSKEKNKTALFYLIKAYELNNHYAKSKVQELYLNKGLKVPSSITVLEK